jgi:hypothetical protein
LVTFNNYDEKKNAVEILNNINKLNKCSIFDLDTKKSGKLSIFLTLAIRFEINKNFNLHLNKIDKISLYKYVSFVALKNGMHSAKGFFYTNLDTNFLKFKNNFNIVKIFYIINSIFKKNEKVFN